MPSKQRLKRIKQTHAEFEKSVQDAAEEAVITSVDDSALFVVDRKASKSGLKKVEKELKPKENKTFISPTEKALIDKVLKKRAHSETESVMDFAGKKYGDRYVDIVPRGKRTATTAHGKVELALEDLWGNSVSDKDVPITVAMKKTPFDDPNLNVAISIPSSIPKYRRKELKSQDNQDAKKKRSVKVAVPGQSYHPTQEDHQNALAEALALEMKRQEQLEANRKDVVVAVDPKKQKEIAALLLDEDHDDSDDSSDDDSERLVDMEDGDVDDATNKKIKKVTKALTKAQRNKKRARRQAEYEEKKIRQEAALLKSIDKVEKFEKDRIAHQAKLEMAKKARELKKKQSEDEKRKGLSAHEVSAIPLSDELSGSLRCVVPKGVAVVDRTSQMLQNGDVFDNHRRNRRKIEKPHGASKVVWIPKYKTHEA